MLFKYHMIINGEVYKALFINEVEADIFLNENEENGDLVYIENVEKISIEDALHDMDFPCYYLYETVCTYLLGEEECRTRFKTFDDMKDYLDYRGFLY